MEKGMIRVSVITFCHDGKGKYAISKRSQQCRDEQGKWEPVAGGGLKFGEKITDAAIREIKEESGASVKDLEYIGYRDVFREQDGEKTHWVTFDFRALVEPSEVKIAEPHKCDEQRWVTIDELAAMDDLHSQFPAFLEKYKDILI
jgi:ADP-ribose pyrophosphatase YjhB (NUDIX family)